MDTLSARRQMVDQQIRTWEVLDPRVLDVLAVLGRDESRLRFKVTLPQVKPWTDGLPPAPAWRGRRRA